MVPSVVFLEIGADYLIDHPRIGVRIAEGILGGEQRGRSNKLQMELDPGKYEVLITQPEESDADANSNALVRRGNGQTSLTKHCMDFDYTIRATPKTTRAALSMMDTNNKDATGLGSMQDSITSGETIV